MWTDDQRQELRRVMSAPVLIPPVPTLAALRRTVLAIRDDRCPKWRFRLAEDSVMQLQPRPGERRDRYYLFIGMVLQGPGITCEHFKSWQTHDGMPAIAIGIGNGPDGQWRVEMTRWSLRPQETMQALKDRTIDGLVGFGQLTLAMRFEPACLCCGKPLTDPVSMARWIGPECAGTARLDVGCFALPQMDGEPEAVSIPVAPAVSAAAVQAALF